MMNRCKIYFADIYTGPRNASSPIQRYHAERTFPNRLPR